MLIASWRHPHSKAPHNVRLAERREKFGLPKSAEEFANASEAVEWHMLDGQGALRYTVH